jgi:hypothetical protein
MNIFKRIKRAARHERIRRETKRMSRLQGFRYFKRKCIEAERLARETGKRYRVYLFDRYRAYSRQDIQLMKNRGVISKKQETGMYSNLVLYDTLTKTITHPDFLTHKIEQPCTFLWRKLKRIFTTSKS